MTVRHRHLIAGLAVLLVMPACSASGDATTASTTSAPPSAAAPLAPTTSSVPTTTTSTVPVPSTTTTTAPPPLLDRSDEATAARMQHDLAVLLFGGPRISGTRSELVPIQYFALEAAAITGELSVIQPVPLPNGTESHNAWAAQVGSGDRTLVLGGHIDSVAGSPGADDNGSGVVVLLEVLRRLVENPPDGLKVLVVAFGAEEYVPGFDHHYGSELAVEEMAAEDALPDLMLSVDMIGIGDVLYVVDYRNRSVAFADEIAAAAEASGIDVVRRSRGDISDHVPFAIAGIPAALLLRGENPNYHTPRDDVADDAALLGTLRVVEILLEHLENQ